MADTSTAKRNQSIGKALHIMEVMAAADGPMRLQDIGKKVGLPPSTVLRFLKTLIDHGYAAQNQQTSQYYLTLKLCELSERLKRQVRIRDIAHPYLLELSRELGEATSLAIHSDSQVVYVDVIEGPDHILKTLQRIGKIAPMNATGVGKALLESFSEEDLASVVKKGLPRITPQTITTRKALLEELEIVRERGYATDDEECEIGVRCVAAPVRDYSGQAVAAISTSGPTGRMSDERMKQVATRIREAASKISRELGFES